MNQENTATAEVINGCMTGSTDTEAEATEEGNEVNNEVKNESMCHSCARVRWCYVWVVYGGDTADKSSLMLIS